MKVIRRTLCLVDARPPPPPRRRPSRSVWPLASFTARMRTGRHEPCRGCGTSHHQSQFQMLRLSFHAGVGIEVPHLALSRNVFGMPTSDQLTLRDDADELVGAADRHIAHTSTNVPSHPE